MATNRENKLLIYLIMILGFVMGFLYSTGSDATANIEPLELELQTAALQSLRTARIDESIVNSEVFKSLQVFGSLPVDSATGGKSNPFQ